VATSFDLWFATAKFCMEVLFATGQEAVKASLLLFPSLSEGGIWPFSLVKGTVYVLGMERMVWVRIFAFTP